MDRTLCDGCARIDCDGCNVLNSDKIPQFRIKEIFNVKFFDKNGTPIEPVPESQEEPDWRKDYAKYKENEK